MVPVKIRAGVALAAGVAVWMAGCGPDEATRGEPVSDSLAAFASCLTERGWILYGSATCSACRAQNKAFGAAFQRIIEIECNPHMPGAQVERCLEHEIRVTPTWLRHGDGDAIERLEGYQSLEALAAASHCPL
jgi:hypothetical protein